MLRLLADENFHGAIVRGLRRLRPDVDLIRVQDVGLGGAGDPAVLAWAAANDRIVLTHDHRTMPGHADDRVAAGEPMPGLFVLSGLTVRRAIDELILAVECSTHGEWAGLIQRFPL